MSQLLQVDISNVLRQLILCKVLIVLQVLIYQKAYLRVQLCHNLVVLLHR